VLKEREEEEKRARGEEVKKEAIAGTGGTDLVSFLKRCRDRTAEAKLAEE
jgi:indoleamine 2,3-dioxygenase